VYNEDDNLALMATSKGALSFHTRAFSSH